MQGGAPQAGYPVRWVQAYWRYAAASAEVGGVPVRRMGLGRWVFFSSLVESLIGCVKDVDRAEGLLVSAQILVQGADDTLHVTGSHDDP